MYKHWAIAHKDLEDPPNFKFKVVKKHSDPLSRLIHEAVRIMSSASLNSKSEWGGFKIARLTVDPPEWEKKKLSADQTKREKVENEALLQFKEVKLNATSNKKGDSNCRKRPQEMAEIPKTATGAVPKRAKSDQAVTGQADSSASQGMLKTMPLKLVSTRHGVWDPKKVKITKSKKPPAARSDSAEAVKLKKWLNRGSVKTSTPVKHSNVCEETFVVSSPTQALSALDCPSNAVSDDTNVKSSTSVSSGSPKCDFDSTTSSMFEAVSEAYSLNVAETCHEDSSVKVITFGSTCSSDDRALCSALDRSNVSAVLPVILHDVLLCSDDAANMVLGSSPLNGFARNEDLVETTGNDIKFSNEGVVRDLVVMGQGRDLLPESLGPGVKLGPSRTSEEGLSCFARNEEDFQPGATVEKCEVSALIWNRMVENSSGKRPSFSTKRPADDLGRPSKNVEFDTMLKKMKLVKLDCPSSVGLAEKTELGPAMPLSDQSVQDMPSQSLISGTKFDHPDQHVLGTVPGSDVVFGRPNVLEQPMMDEIGSLDKSECGNASRDACNLQSIASNLGSSD